MRLPISLTTDDRFEDIPKGRMVGLGDPTGITKLSLSLLNSTAFLLLLSLVWIPPAAVTTSYRLFPPSSPSTICAISRTPSRAHTRPESPIRMKRDARCGVTCERRGENGARRDWSRSEVKRGEVRRNVSEPRCYRHREPFLSFLS